MDTKPITEAENLLSEENVERYSKLYQLDKDETIKALKKIVIVKQSLLGCGLSGDSLNIESIFKQSGGTLPVDEDSVEQTIEGGVTQTEEASREEAAKEEVKAKDELLAKASEQMHGPKED